MKIQDSIIFTLLLIPSFAICQSEITGVFEYQTGATERMGEILDILPDNTYTRFSKHYQQTIERESGKWKVHNDTIFFTGTDTNYVLQIDSENLLKTIVQDSIAYNSILKLFAPTYWTRTKSYYNNGQVEASVSWWSISDFFHHHIPHGIWIYYYPNGDLRAVGKFKKGKKRGKWFYLDENGNKITEPNNR